MLQVEDHLNFFSAQYLVHSLVTENIYHHITTMDHPPREMKETLFTRHNQTVLPLLANTKKDLLQAIHTSFVNTAIDNKTSNPFDSTDIDTGKELIKKIVAETRGDGMI